MTNIQSFTFNDAFYENTYVLYDDTKESIIIDPGCYREDEKLQLKNFIEENNLKVVSLINTHCHIDHVLGNDFVKDTFKVPLFMHRTELEIYLTVKAYAEIYGFPNYKEAPVDGYIEEGQKIQFGNTLLNTLFVPGHSPGHIAFFHEKEKFCIAGDVLFDGSIGRTDLPGGDFDTLISSIQNQLFKLDDDVIIYPGHGPTTTLGKEKNTNPFCAIRK